MSELAPRPDAPPLAPQADRQVLRLVPKGYRRPLAFFWSLNQHLLPNPLPLAARVQLWVAKEGLTPEELKEVFNRLASPERAARHQFAGQLLADLAALVAETVARRRQQEDAAVRRRAEELAKADAITAEQVRALLARRFGMPGTHPGETP